MFHSTIDNPDGDIKASDNKSGDNKNSRLDLYNLVSHHPEATFFIKYQGSDLEDLNIFDQDVLVVDRSVNPKPGKVAVIILNGEFKIENISQKNNNEITVWGIVTFIIHKT